MNESRERMLHWNDDTVYALGIYRLFGRILGIWPPTCRHFSSKVIFVIVAVLQLDGIYNLISEFANGCIPVEHTADFVALITANGICLLKMTIIRIHREEMCCIVESAVYNWSNVRDDKSRVIMRKYAHSGKLISILPFGIGLASIAVLVIFSPPNFSRIDYNTNDSLAAIKNTSVVELRNLPMGTGCSVIDLSNFRYLVVYTYQCIQLVCICCCNLGCDAMFYGVSMHICAQLRLLKLDIAELDRRVDEKIKVESRMSAWIARHNHLLLLMNYVENIFHLVIFGLLAASGSYILLTGIQMLFALLDEAFVMVAYLSISISCLLVQLFTYCFVGDYLTSHANDLQIGAYSCPWYDFSTGLARDVAFVLMKSNRAYRLTAGKVLSMNIESFTSIVKTMASFFSVMKLTIVK